MEKIIPKIEGIILDENTYNDIMSYGFSDRPILPRDRGVRESALTLDTADLDDVTEFTFEADNIDFLAKD